MVFAELYSKSANNFNQFFLKKFFFPLLNKCTENTGWMDCSKRLTVRLCKIWIYLNGFMVTSGVSN